MQNSITFTVEFTLSYEDATRLDDCDRSGLEANARQIIRDLGYAYNVNHGHCTPHGVYHVDKAILKDQVTVNKPSGIDRVRALLDADKLVPAIKEFRAAYGVGLREARDIVEAMRAMRRA